MLHDTRRVAILRGIFDNYRGRQFDAVYRERLETLSDDAIREIAADPVAHQWLGYNKLRELACVISARDLGWDCLPLGFTLEPSAQPGP